MPKITRDGNEFVTPSHDGLACVCTRCLCGFTLEASDPVTWDQGQLHFQVHCPQCGWGFTQKPVEHPGWMSEEEWQGLQTGDVFVVLGSPQEFTVKAVDYGPSVITGNFGLSRGPVLGVVGRWESEPDPEGNFTFSAGSAEITVKNRRGVRLLKKAGRN